MTQLIAVWIGVAVVAAVVAVSFVLPEDEILGGLGNEGRVVVAILGAAVWPLFLLVGVAWLVRALCIGLAQVWRLLVPAKAELPKAQVRK